MDTVKVLITKALDLLHVGDELPFVGPAVHPALVGVLGIVVLHVTAVLPVTALTAVLTTAVLLAVEEFVYSRLS